MSLENNKSCILLSHVHVYDNEAYKHDILNFSINYFRKHNPGSYIILTGHGLRPSNDLLTKYDHYEWCDTVDESEIGRGHPKDVSKGLDHAISKGFEYVLKCRADSILAIPGIENYCLSILNKESKDLLVSYGTCDTNFWLGDLVLFSELKLLRKVWNDSQWDYTTNGLENFGRSLDRELNCNQDPWLSFIRSEVSYRDPDSLKWVDLLGPHPHTLMKWNQLEPHTELIIENDFNIDSFIWGKDWKDTPSSYLKESTFYVN